MTITPRRSTRGAGIFAPSPLTPAFTASNVTFTWASGPTTDTTSNTTKPSSSSSSEAGPSSKRNTYYRSFDRITSHTGLTPRRKGGQGKGQKKDDVDRFTVGDGVLVSVEGGNDGVGILIRLWEEPGDDDDDDERDVVDDDEEQEQEQEKSDDGGEKGPKMMAEIHWCFRRQDLPGIMKNLSVEDVSIDHSFFGPMKRTSQPKLTWRTVALQRMKSY